MINFRVIARVFSLIIIIEGLFMLLSAGVAFLYGEPASLLFSGIITLISGALVFTPLRNEEKLSGQKEGYIIITGMWFLLSLFGTIPYLLSGTITNFVDAFFESVSGFTTTGATILSDIESVPHGILFWRSVTQWMGGLGFIIISLSVLQVIRNVNIQLPINDFTGQTGDKIHPKITESAKRLVFFYVILTGLEAVLLIIGGMDPFDSVCHSFTTMSTGGFSTQNNNIGAYASPFILITITVFMFLAGTNMTIFYFGFKRRLGKIRENNEFRFFLITCIGFVTVSTLVLWLTGQYHPGRAFVEGAFQSVSVITTTGYYHSNYNFWGDISILLIFLMMFTGGTSGSASSGIKIIRLLLMTRNARHETRKMIHPSAVIPVRLDNKTVSHFIINNLLVFITLYLIILCTSAFITSLMDYDIITSFSTSAAMLGNIGPGIGSFGPFSTYAPLPAGGKLFFSFLMITGRLELFSILVFFTGSFYRR